MKKSQPSTDLLATFDEAAKRMISQSMDFQMDIQDFEAAAQDYETDAQVFNAATEVFGTAMQAFETAAKNFREADQKWKTISQSIKASTSEFKRDAMDFQRAIPKFRETFKNLLKQTAQTSIVPSPQENGHTKLEDSVDRVRNEDQRAVNGDQMNGVCSKPGNIVLIDVSSSIDGKWKPLMESENEAISDGSTSSGGSAVNRHKEENGDEHRSNETTPGTLQSQTSSIDDQDQAKPANKLKRRAATKPKAISVPKLKVRRHSVDTPTTRAAAHLESLDIIKKLDSKKKKTKKEKQAKKMEGDNPAEVRKEETGKPHEKTKEKSMKNGTKSTKIDKKAMRTTKSPATVESVIQNVSIENEHKENTFNSTANSSVYAIPKNTDREKHAKHKVYQKFCLFCDHAECDQLVAHYVDQHPEHEVPISRPAVRLADTLRSHCGKFKIEGDIIDGNCYFCDEVKSMTQSNWAEHYLNHTGESNVACGDSDNKSKRRKISGKEVFKLNSTDASLLGFMCNDCNYLKVHLPAIQKHLKDEHGYESQDVRKQYQKITLVPDLSPLQSDDLTKYDYIAVATRFKCTICDESTDSSKEFAAHFKKVHKGVQQYDCLCGKKLVARDGQLTDKMVTDHLSMHSNDLYQCMVCTNVFQRRSDVRNHSYTEHPEDAINYLHLCRSSGHYNIFAETRARKFECKTCRRSIAGTVAKLIEHFKAKHGSDDIRSNMIHSKKVTYLGNRPNGIDTKYSGCISSNFQFDMPQENGDS